MNELQDIKLPALLRDAFLFYSKILQDCTNGSEKHRLKHPEHIACLLSRFIDDEEVMAAAILQDVLSYNITSAEDLQELFDTKVAELVYELTLSLDDNAINRNLQLSKHYNTISPNALTIRLVTKLHEVMGLTDSIIPDEFVSWYIKDMEFILHNLNRELNKEHNKLIYLIKFAMFYVELTRNI